jgi:Rod binding domain-containing protein
VHAAYEFEGQMMQQLLKPMTHGDALTGTDADADSGVRARVERWASLPRKRWGQSLSERGGLGIAKQIIQELSHPGNQHQGVKVTKKSARQGQGIRTT